MDSITCDFSENQCKMGLIVTGGWELGSETCCILLTNHLSQIWFSYCETDQWCVQNSEYKWLK